jgi:hypothetical protein
LGYTAPEILAGTGHNQAADIFSLGVLICEMGGGFTPFREDDSMSLLDKMRQGDMELPKNMDGVTRDLVKQCLVYD